MCVCERDRKGVFLFEREREYDVNSRLSRTNLLISASLTNVLVFDCE